MCERHQADLNFGSGNSASQFLKALEHDDFWSVSPQKIFQDI
jgi:hypothetical protein